MGRWPCSNASVSRVYLSLRLPFSASPCPGFFTPHPSSLILCNDPSVLHQNDSIAKTGC